jgi:hypothetical protein
LARLTVLIGLPVPSPKPRPIAPIREEREQIRKAFPQIDFDHPKPHRRSSPPKIHDDL